jgi:predicted acetyltransferase
MSTSLSDKITLQRPSMGLLASYQKALEAGWVPGTVDNVGRDHLARIAKDPAAFLAYLEQQGGSFRLPDGSEKPRLPQVLYWMVDDDGVCGRITMRWQPGTNDLPDYTLGHISYSVVPWKLGRGYATQALEQILDVAREKGLTQIQIATTADNPAARRVIEWNGGELVEKFEAPSYGRAARLRYVIDLTD